MLPKAPITTLTTVVITLGDRDTSIVSDLDIVTMAQLKSIIKQNNTNNQILVKQLRDIKKEKIKMPLIKRFVGEKYKLRGFFI